MSSGFQRGAKTALFLCLVAAFAIPVGASAQDAYSCIDDMSDDDVRYRTEFIEGSFRDGLTHSRRWKYGWMGGYLALSGTTLQRAVDAHRDGKPWDRFGSAYLAAGGIVLALQHAFLPASDTWGLRRIRKMPSDTPEQRKEKLRYATEKLEAAAFTQDFYGGPGGPVVSMLFGVVGGSIKAAKWPGRTKGWTASLFITPFVLSMIRAIGSPKHSYYDWEKYRGMACTGKYYDKGGDPELDFDLGLGNAGFTVTF